jgi:hypothetical protein
MLEISEEPCTGFGGRGAICDDRPLQSGNQEQPARQLHGLVTTGYSTDKRGDRGFLGKG